VGAVGPPLLYPVLKETLPVVYVCSGHCAEFMTLFERAVVAWSGGTASTCSSTCASTCSSTCSEVFQSHLFRDAAELIMTHPPMETSAEEDHILQVGYI
jgi:hypothetical protein